MEKHSIDLVLKSDKIYNSMNNRRSSRYFKKDTVPLEAIKNCIKTAGTAPSGANLQPWTFVIVANSKIKQEIRNQAEKIEKMFYKDKISDEWRNDIEELKTNWEKPFLTEAPYLICIFLKRYDLDMKGNKKKVYYPNESTGIATGFLISALHQTGLSCLTYTPAPMSFLGRLLKRPENERPYMILPVGYPEIQDIEKREKKPLEEILTIL